MARKNIGEEDIEKIFGDMSETTTYLCFDGAQIAIQLQKLGVEYNKLQKLMLQTASNIHQMIPDEADKGDIDCIHLFSHMFLLVAHISALSKESELLVQPSVRLVYKRYKDLCEQLGLLDDNGNLRE